MSLFEDNVISAFGAERVRLIDVIGLYEGYKVENENGSAIEPTSIAAARLAMKLLQDAGCAPTEQLYCEVLSALQQKARLVDLCFSGNRFFVDVIDRGGLAESWTVPARGSLYQEPT